MANIANTMLPKTGNIPIMGSYYSFFNLMLFYYMYFLSLNYFIAGICDYTNLFAFSFNIFFFQTSIKCLFPNSIFTSIWILLSNYFAANLNISLMNLSLASSQIISSLSEISNSDSNSRLN